MITQKGKKYILGGGMTGLAAGISSGLPVLEAAGQPGGICSSYYMRPGAEERLPEAPTGGAYRFEIGGGHWIFGGDPVVLRFIKELVPMNRYSRSSAVYFAESGQYAPYPLQNNLSFLDDEELAAQILQELTQANGEFRTMKEWLEKSFGPSLCSLFFYPFHDLYTAGLYDRIAPQDAYKSPVNLGQVIQGAFPNLNAQAAGYNVTFLYPQNGLNALAQQMAALCDVHYDRRVMEIDVDSRQLLFSDGSSAVYETLLSTLPLNRMMEMSGLTAGAKPDPFTSVLVLNIGAVRGPNCPDAHWLYNPDARSGFHRVGFYSNVEPAFLPQPANDQKERVSIYIERAYVGGTVPTEAEVKLYQAAVVEELQAWGYIEEAEVVDPTWIDVAYTWSWPGSTWKKEALRLLEEQGIYQVGRYGRWIFQGIADSIRDGFFAGASFKELEAVDLYGADLQGRDGVAVVPLEPAKVRPD